MTASTDGNGPPPLAPAPPRDTAGPVPITAGRLLLCVLSVQAALTLAVTTALHAFGQDFPDSPVVVILPGSIAAALVAAAVIRNRTHQDPRESFIPGRIGDLLGAGPDWLWAVDSKGIFTFSSQASASLLGYAPSDLLGRPLSTVLDDADRASARRNGAHLHDQRTGEWAGVVVAFRHRNGTSVWIGVTGTARRAPDGTEHGFEGVGRLLPGQTVRTLLHGRSMEHAGKTGRARAIITAFQPVHNLSTGTITGVEALARFPGDTSLSPDHWFTDATTAGLVRELDFAALQTALQDAAGLPANLTVALNLSPETCLDPRLPRLLDEAGIHPHRIVLELTERQPVDDYDSLLTALAPLRNRGLRVAVDDAGSGFSCMRHILQLQPDIIKLDRSLITGIHANPRQRALGAAMVQFAQETGATIVAEGIETEADLATARGLGIHAGQGYLLGHPTTHAADWATWHAAAACSATDEQAA
ncbi:EAL domain-containing protein [Pseudarthrobacter sp. NPDC080039]|uniref:sensor domain-containing phosphodiesterase n=1 Tax=unclassified Pseudarthrobacter TaxID=2647000 RepID=UPI00344CA6FA